MTTFNVGGLVSGIDTASLIDQLMTAAALPQGALQKQVAVDQNQIAAYQAVNTKMAAVKTAADALTSADTWKATTATSSSTSVIATGGTSAQAGSFTTFSVTKVAQPQVSTLALTGDAVTDPTAGIDIVGADGTTTTHVALTDGTAAGVAAAVNAAGLGVRASVITTDGGQVLQFSATSTGTASAFTVNGLAGVPQTLLAAQNAQVTVGDPAAGGYTVSSSSNTFTNAIQGVTFTVSAPVSNVTISVASDQTSISTKVQAMVTAINGALTEIGSDTGQGALMQGNSTLQGLQQKLLSAISAGTSAGGSFSAFGVGINSTGQLTFDASAFATAYAANPSGAQSTLGELATTYSTTASSATDSTTGTLTQLITSENADVTSLNKQISDWTTKLADQKAMLTAKYAAMESALSKLKSQSAYLTSMFASSSSSQDSSSSSN